MKGKRPTHLVQQDCSGMAPKLYVTQLHDTLAHVMPKDTNKYMEAFVGIKILKFINYEEEYHPEEHLDILYYQWFYEMITNGYSIIKLIFNPFNPTSSTLPKGNRLNSPVTH